MDTADGGKGEPDADRPRLSAGQLVRRNPEFGRLLAAEVVSPLGDAMGILALILYVQRVRGTGTAVGVLLLADTLAPLASPLAGTLADRVDHRRAMLAMSIGQAAVVMVMVAFLPSLPVVFFLVFVRGLLATAFQPAARAIVPTLVPDADLPSANALVSGGRELGVIIGPPLAGFLFPVLGARGVLAIDAATFLAVVPILAGLPRHEPSAAGAATTSGIVADTVEGLRYVLGHRLTRAIVIGFWLIVLTTAADDLVLPFLGRDVLGAGPFGIGVLLAGASLGVVLGMAGVARWTRRMAPVTAVVAGFAITSAGNLATAVAPTVAVAVGAQMVRGLGNAFIEANIQTLLQRGVPRRLLGRVMANVWGGVGVAAAASYAVGGPLLDTTSPRTMFVVIGAGGFAATVLTMALMGPYGSDR